MSLIDIILQRRPKTHSQSCRPCVEMLEERQCLSVAAPTGVHLAVVSTTQVKVMWNDVAGELGFDVYRWNGTKSILITNVPKGQLSLTVGGLQPNTIQYFSVTAFDRATSARSAWVSIMTPADAITAPTKVHVGNVTSTQISLAWKNATNVTGYRIYGWNGAQAFLIGTTGPSVPAFTVNNLTSGVTYYFYVQAYNATNFANSDWVSATTSSAGIAAPTGVKTHVLNASTIALSWNNVASETGYRVFLWDGNSADSPVAIATLAANTTGYQAIGLLPGRTYWFYVQAFNATNLANSIWVSAATPAALPLAPPTQVTVVISSPSSVNLAWVEPARAVGYRVAMWTGTYWSLVATVPAGSHQAQITGLAANQTYWFMVEAYTDNFAETAYSGVVFANL